MNVSTVQKNILIQEKLSSNLTYDGLNLVFVFKIQDTTTESFCIKRFKLACKGTFSNFLALSSYFVEKKQGFSHHFIKNSSDLVEQYIRFEDLTDQLDNQQKENSYIKEWKKELYKKQFTLSKFPLWKIEILKVTEKTHIVAFVFHHTITDAISIKRIFDYLSSAYNGFSCIKTPDKVQKNLYLQYLNLENDFRVLYEEKVLNYYKQYMAKGNFNCQIPWNNKRSEFACRKYHRIDGKLVKSITKLAESFVSTKFCILLSIFSCFISRFINQESITIGYPIGKRLKGLENLDFYQVNTLPINETINVEARFQEVNELIKKQHKFNLRNKLIDIQKLKHTVCEGFAHSEYNIVFSSTYFGNLELTNLNIKNIDLNLVPAIQDLIFYIDMTKQEWILCIEYREELFPEKVACSLLESFVYFIQQICTNPMSTVKEYKLSEEETICIAKSKQTKPFRSVIEAIEQNGINFPNIVAIEDEVNQISYARLNILVNKGAKFLQDLGIKRSDRVAIMMSKNIVPVITILSILKVGGCYIPIDHNLPLKRIKNICFQVKPKVILTNISSLPTKNFAKDIIVTMTLDSIEKVNMEIDSFNLSLIVEEDYAYIIFTSGSTGQPKGVIVTHRGLSNLAFSQGDILGIDKKTKTLLFSSLSFDASVSEIFTTLVYGGTLIVSHQNQNELTAMLPSLSSNFHFNTITLPPSVLSFLDPGDIQGVDTVLSAGERMTTPIISKWSEKVRLFNAYGPTENTVCVSMHRVSAESLPNNVGTPLSGISVFIDSHEQIMPIGAIGEICVGGKSLSKGYINNSELTALSFAEKKINGELQTYYKTGDFGYLTGSEIICLGRKDRQVKIKGFRVELEEIQEVLEVHHAIERVYACVVNELEPYIAIFVVSILSEEEIILLSSKFLPQYMVPKRVIKLDKLPINSSGKIDQTILNKYLENNFLPPNELVKNHDNIDHKEWDEVSKEIRKIWERILQCNVVSLHDNFFELGGESLKAAKLMLELRKTFGFSLDIAEFFDNPTISYCKRLVGNTCVDYSNKLNTIDVIADNTLPLINQNIGNTNSRTIMLTGATGFIGTYLLHYLSQEKTLNKIYCLGREYNNNQFLYKLNSNLKEYGLPPISRKLIAFINCDLSKPNLGLCEKVIRIIEEDVTDIIHAAALVHHLYDYKTLKTTNVQSTIELIKLCSIGKQKKFHYISALSAINDLQEQTILENWPQKEECTLSGGYNQTKWASEVIIKTAYLKGYKVAIYRLPTVWGDRKTSVFPWYRDHQALMIRGCLEMGFFPEVDVNLILAPVDHIASCIVKAVFDNDISSNVFNFIPYLPYSLVGAFQKFGERGFHCQLISFKEWQKKLSNISPKNSLYPLASLYLGYSEYKKKFDINSESVKNFMNITNNSIQVLDISYLEECARRFLSDLNTQ